MNLLILIKFNNCSPVEDIQHLSTGELKSYKVMETIEHKIGDTFCLKDGTKLEVIKSVLNCKGCYFFNDKNNRCSRTKDIVCSATKRTDKEFVIFKQIKDNNNMKKKTTIDIYVVMQTHKQYRSFCNVFTSFEEADARFEALLNHYESINKVQPRGWTTETIPSQIKVSIIGDITLYLCKETKEIDIEVDSNKQSSDIYKKDVLGKWINTDDIDPIEIKDLKPGDYIILRVQHDSTKFDYKLACVNYIKYGKIIFNIQGINILRFPTKVTDFCILPDYISDNFYKQNNK